VNGGENRVQRATHADQPVACRRRIQTQRPPKEV
jgi:hypothetical protein